MVRGFGTLFHFVEMPLPMNPNTLFTGMIVPDTMVGYNLRLITFQRHGTIPAMQAAPLPVEKQGRGRSGLGPCIPALLQGWPYSSTASFKTVGIHMYITFECVMGGALAIFLCCTGNLLRRRRSPVLTQFHSHSPPGVSDCVGPACAALNSGCAIDIHIARVWAISQCAAIKMSDDVAVCHRCLSIRVKKLWTLYVALEMEISVYSYVHGETVRVSAQHKLHLWRAQATHWCDTYCPSADDTSCRALTH